MEAPRDYKDFYDLFGVTTDAEKSEIKERADDMMQKFHPDKADERIAASPTQFKTMKTARDTLVDDEKREEYDELGHIEYVEKYHDDGVDGFTFTGRKTIEESEVNEPDEEEVDELMQNNYDYVEDVTEDRQVVDPEAGDDEEKRQRLKEQRKKDTPASIKLLVSIGGFLTNPKFRFVLLILFLGWFYWTLYTTLNLVAAIFAILLTIGFAYHPKVRVLFTAPFKDE